MSTDPKLDLREMVRDVLRDVMAARSVQGGGEVVSIATNAELQAFIVRICVPGVVERLRSGSLKFALDSARLPAQVSYGAGLQTPTPAAPHRLDGVISERILKGIAPGSKVLLGSNAVLTPLAKEIGRNNGLIFDRTGR